jgi:hypothetical protein
VRFWLAALSEAERMVRDRTHTLTNNRCEQHRSAAYA